MTKRHYITRTMIAAASIRPRPAIQNQRVKKAIRMEPYWRGLFWVIGITAAVLITWGIYLAITVP